MAPNSLPNAVMKLSLIACVVILFALPSGALAFSCSQAPGLRYPLIDWRSVNGGALPQTFTYGMKEDTLAVTIEAGTRQNLGPDEMVIILGSAGSWMWRKEIVSFNSREGLGSTIRTDVGSAGPQSMRVTRAKCGSFGTTDTIVFRKVDALGWLMRDMYHLDIDHFWSMFGGKIVTFRWLEDNYGDPNTDPQYPPDYLSPFTIPFDRNLAAVSGVGATYNRIDLFETVTSLRTSPDPFRLGSLHHSWSDGLWRDENLGWSAQQYEHPRPLTSSPAASYRGYNDLDVFVRDDCNRLIASSGISQPFGWQWHWGSFNVSCDYSNLGARSYPDGGLTSSPASRSSGPRVDVVARGGDFALWHMWYDTLGGYGDWQSLGGAFTSAPAIVSSGPDSFDVFGRGMDSAIWMNSWNGSSWTGWSSLGGVLTSDPAAVVYGTAYGTPHIAVFARGMDNALWVIVNNGSGWGQWGSLGGILTSAPAAAARDGHIDVFVRGTDDKVWQRSWTTPWGVRGYGGQPASSGSTGWGPWSPPALPFCTAC